MTKYDPLTDQQMAGYSMNREVLRQLEAARRRLGLPRDQFRVLDWGCGKGEAVAWLRDRGYCACGADINPQYIANGRSFLHARGHDADWILQTIDGDGRTPWQTEQFHFVFSLQVFEHVADLDRAVAELARLTAPGGIGWHTFPAHRQPLEHHLRLPLLQYLPKNRLLQWWLRLCCVLGGNPRWPQFEHLTLSQQVEQYYRYLVDTTFYRPPRTIRRVLRRYGLTAAMSPVDRPAVRDHRLARWLLALPGGRRLANWLLVTFVTVDLTTVKAAASPQSQPAGAVVQASQAAVVQAA